MAQLGNLLVTGSGRFLQKVYFGDDLDINGTISTSGLNVGSGIKLSSTKADFTVPVTISSNLTVQNGVVSADRINSKSIYVSDVLNATRYEIATIQSLGGIFDVCPSFKTSSSATATITNVSSSINLGYNFDGVTSVSLTGYYRLIIKDTKQITSNTLCGSTWTRYSKVKITGSINNIAYNSIDAYLLYDLNSGTAGAITLVVPKSTFDSALTAVSNVSCPDVDIVLTDIYKSVGGTTAKRRPVGMYLASYNGSMGTGVTIYDGNSNDPTLLLGDLSNSSLPKINDLTPQGWGLYATNAFLQGTIVSESGVIGGWRIKPSSMSYDADNYTVYMMPMTNEKNDFLVVYDKTNNIYPFFVRKDGLHANRGTIGNWNISSTSIYSGNELFKDASSMYFGEDGLSIKDKFYIDSSCNTVYIGVNKTESGSATNGAALKLSGSTIDFMEAGTSVASFTKDEIYLGKTSTSAVINLCNGTGQIKNANPIDKYQRLVIESSDSVEINTSRIVKMSTAIGNVSATIGMNSCHIPWDSGYDGDVKDGSIILRTTHEGFDMTSKFIVNPWGFQFINNSGTIESMSSQLNVGMDTVLMGSSVKTLQGTVIYANDNVFIAKGKSIRSYDTEDKERHILGFSSDNNVILGYGMYAAKATSSTIICAGDKILLQLGKQNAAWKPYYESGDTITFNGIKTGGFVTGSSKEVHFSVPISKPIIGASSVTITTVSGLVVRQGGKYLYGSSSDTYAKPSSYGASIVGNCINIRAIMPNATNVVSNNDACGIQASIKVTFS